MNVKIRKQIDRRKRRILRRLDKDDNRGAARPMMTAANIHYEIAGRTRATVHGGIGAIHLLVKRLGLDAAIDAGLGLLKLHLPYRESDHTAGDFCRRFRVTGIFRLQQIFNAIRQQVWRQQPKSFFAKAIIDADGTQSEHLDRWDQEEDVTFTFGIDANGRCNQENLLQQLKGDVRSLTAPLDNLLSTWAYMVMGSLAWSLKAWAALLLPESGRWQEKHRAEKGKLLRMDFSTFRAAMIRLPAQIVTAGRRIVYRLLAWNPWQHVFFRLLDQLRQPLRC